MMRVLVISPERAVFESISPATGCFAAIDVRKMTRPHFLCRIPGTHARASRIELNKFS